MVHEVTHGHRNRKDVIETFLTNAITHGDRVLSRQLEKSDNAAERGAIEEGDYDDDDADGDLDRNVNYEREDEKINKPPQLRGPRKIRAR